MARRKDEGGRDRQGPRPPRGPGGHRDDRREHRRDHSAERNHRGDSGHAPIRPSQPLLYGMHAVIEALANPRRKLGRLFVTENALSRLKESVGEPRRPPFLVRGDELDRLLPQGAVHQGIAVEAEPLPALDIDDLPENGLVLVLDQITDPHNVGAIIRTASAFAADGIIITERHSPDMAGVLAKTASGGLEHVPLIVVSNLSQALMKLGDRGYWRVGLDSDAPAPIGDLAGTRPLALVLGAEGKGLRRLTRERCDTMARLDMPGVIKSLNVSNACAIALYAVSRAD